MRRVLILAVLIFAGTTQGECATTFFSPLQAPTRQSTVIQDNSVTTANWGDNFSNPLIDSYANLGKVELALFGKIYSNQNIANRLSRIERALFTTTYPNSPNAQRIDNIISNFNQINKNPNISKNTLSRLESKIFNQNFVQNSAQRRIERLEEQIFGAAQSGDLDARCKALQIAAKSYNSNSCDYNDGFSDPMSMSQSNLAGRTGALGRFLGSMGAVGAMTGFTPSVNPYGGYNNYNGYNNGFNTPFQRSNPYLSRHGMEQGYNSNHGYGYGFKDYGSGATVTILD